MCAWRFVTGLRGVVVRLLRLLNRSRREEDETVRVADVNALRTSIVLKLTGATGARQTASRKLVCWSESTAREV